MSSTKKLIILAFFTPLIALGCTNITLIENNDGVAVSDTGCFDNSDTADPPFDPSTGANNPGNGDSSGLGQPCETQDDCDHLQADLCLLNPLANKGYCTFDECAMNGCPTDYTCCDCSETSIFPWEHACVDDDFSVIIDSLFCDCKPNANPDLNVPEKGGLGYPCMSNDECGIAGADLCAINPISSVGYCTYSNCRPDSCPNQYQCCSCENLLVLPESACLTDEDAEMATTLGACQCEELPNTDPNLPGKGALGAPCTSHDECGIDGTDFCFINPVVSFGYCTFSNCRSDSCPSQYQCCSCEGLIDLQGPTCFNDDDAGIATSVGICQCEYAKECNP